jgi:hypothetical protein
MGRYPLAPTNQPPLTWRTATCLIIVTIIFKFGNYSTALDKLNCDLYRLLNSIKGNVRLKLFAFDKWLLWHLWKLGNLLMAHSAALLTSEFENWTVISYMALLASF